MTQSPSFALTHAEGVAVAWPRCRRLWTTWPRLAGDRRRSHRPRDADPRPDGGSVQAACYGGAKPADKHLASRIVCIDEEIVTWLERREQRRRGKQPPSRYRAIDNPDYDESH